MIAVYVILGILALLLIYIAVRYAISSVKIKNKSKKSKEKEKPVESEKSTKEPKEPKEKKPEEKTVFVDESPKETAMKNSFEASKQKEIDEKILVKPVSKKEFDDKNLTELERAMLDSGKKIRRGLEKNVIEEKHLKSETNVIGNEGPVEQQSVEQDKKTDQDEGIDFSNMTDDMKKILIADIIKKKYWFVNHDKCESSIRYFGEKYLCLTFFMTYLEK